MADFVGYEPSREEKIIAGILWSIALILFMIYILNINPTPHFVCNKTCHILNFLLIVSSVIVGTIISLIFQILEVS